jgi:hypothetical protein
MKVISVYAHDPEPEEVSILRVPRAAEHTLYWLNIGEIQILITNAKTAAALADRADELFREMCKTDNEGEIPC